MPRFGMVTGICKVEFITHDYISYKLIKQHNTLHYDLMKSGKKIKNIWRRGKKAEHTACKKVSSGVFFPLIQSHTHALWHTFLVVVIILARRGVGWGGVGKIFNFEC